MPTNLKPVFHHIDQKIAQESVSTSQTIQPPVFRRPILSTIDTYDQNTQVEHLEEAFATGKRPMWNIPTVAVVSSKVGTIKQSANVVSVSPNLATQSGILSGPTTNVATFTVVPNMAQVIRASGPVQVAFSLNASTANASDPVSFAVFRDGVQVSQTYLGSGAANTAFSVIGSYTDNPPAGNHIYDLRWAKGSSVVTAVGKQRTIQVLNLRAQ